MITTDALWHTVRSFGVRQLAAAFSPASSLAENRAPDRNSREQACGKESGSKLPHSKASHVCTPPSAGLNAPTAATYWRTLRHLRWSQLGHLALRRVLPRSNSPVKMRTPVGLRNLQGAWPFVDWQPEASRRMIATREFTFLNRTVVCNGSIPWNDRRHAKLWLYHLNYFDFLSVGFDLPEEVPTLNAALEIMLDWRAHNREGNEVGWEPYALSVRIVNWLKFLARHGRSLQSWGEGKRVNILLESLGVQAATLDQRLEKDLLGNHLLKNIKALLFAGALLEVPGEGTASVPPPSWRHLPAGCRRYGRSERWWAQRGKVVGAATARADSPRRRSLRAVTDVPLASPRRLGGNPALVPRHGKNALLLPPACTEDSVNGAIPERNPSPRRRDSTIQ